MNKKIIILIAIFLILFFMFFVYKILDNGNNKSIKTNQELVEYILNMSSYEAEIEVEVKSNKNTNKYRLKQEFNEKFSRQVVLQPEYISGIEMIYENNKLIINNTKFDLVTIYENYPYIAENDLWLNSFTEEAKKDNNIDLIENEKELQIKIKTKNQIKILKINKETLKPISLEIKDNNKNTKIYIQYNEIEIDKKIDNTSLAFKLK